MKTVISNEGLELLAKIKNQALEWIMAEDWTKFGRSYGNILICVAGKYIQIENDYRVIPYFNSKEELAGFDVRQLKTVEAFDSSVLEMTLRKEIIGKEIKNIEIVRDKVSVCYSDPSRNQLYMIDQAILFEFDDLQWIVSQTSPFTPMAEMIFAKNAFEQIRTVDEIREEWADVPERGRDLLYKTRVTRELIQL